MKSLLLFAGGLALVGSSSALHGTDVSVVINTPGFSDFLGTPTNGMPIAVVVDNAGNGFLPGDYLGFDFSSGNQWLSIDAGETDDWLALPTAGVSTTIFSPIDGDGYVSSFHFEAEVGSTGQAFALIWLADSIATAGSHYGLLTHSDFIVPGEGGTASLGSSVAPGSAGFTFIDGLATIPEPASMVFLLGMAALFMVRRRR